MSSERLPRWRNRTALAGNVQAYQLLFVAHIVGFIALIALPEAGVHDALDTFAISDGSELARRPWTLATYLFLHRTPLEFLVVGGLLLALGAEVERALGSVRFLGLYVASGAVVAIVHVTTPAAQDALGPSFSGGVGATAGLLTAYLFIFHDRRTLGVLPAHGFYALAALSLIATVAYVEYEHAALAKRRFDDLIRADVLRPDEFVDAVHRLALHRADALTHLLGFAVGGAVLCLDLVVARARERARTRREIRVLEEEVVARARVEQLLEKISREGMGSLSARERKFLKYASRFYREDPIRVD